MDIRKFRLVGPASDIQSFLRLLEYQPEFVLVSTEIAAQDVQDDSSEILGELGLIVMLTEFGLGIGAAGTWDLLKSEFERFRARRPAVQMTEVEEVDPNVKTAQGPKAEKESVEQIGESEHGRPS